MVYTERAETAAVSRGTSHVSVVSIPLRWILKIALKTNKQTVSLSVDIENRAKNKQTVSHSVDIENRAKNNQSVILWISKIALKTNSQSFGGY